MIQKCIVCGKEFECKKSTAKYCSRKCSDHARWLRIKTGELMWNQPHKCHLCGKKFIPKTAAANKRTCCYECMPDGIQITRSMFVTKIKEQRGGKCEHCGYDKCTGALEFHHLDPAKKDFTISDANFRLNEAIEESKKCILLCANCHRELHCGIWQLTGEEEVNP